MTPAQRPARPVSAIPERITTDDLRHKALAVRDMAKDEARHALEDNTVRVVLASALIFAVAVSVAYYYGRNAARGSRAGARS